MVIGESDYGVFPIPVRLKVQSQTLFYLNEIIAAFLTTRAFIINSTSVILFSKDFSNIFKCLSLSIQNVAIFSKSFSRTMNFDENFPCEEVNAKMFGAGLFLSIFILYKNYPF